MELPKGICNLLNLQHLDIIGTTKLQEMPPHIGNLTSLRVLTKFVIGKGNEQITELKKLSDLQGQLHITSLENVEVEDIRDVGVANLKDKPGITELCLEWIDKFSSDLRNSSDEEQVLDSLRPHRRLSSLSITSFGGREFSSWLGEFSFSSMVQVKLSNCCQITSLPPLGRLKSLKKLSIESLSGVKEVGVEFYEDDSCFSCLEALEISNMGQWDLWAWHNGVGGDSVAKFPKLHELRIQSCPKLVGKLPTFLPSLEKLVISNCLLLVDLPAVLPSLKNIHISNCPQLVDLPEVLPSLVTLSIRRCQEAVLRRVTNATSLISLKHLEIKGCNELVSLVDGKEGLLPCNLEILNIHVCPNLKELPSGLNNLKSLKDLSISQCGSLVSFPARGLPHSLIRLRIDNCDSLASLPEGIVSHSGATSHLEEIHIFRCKSLRYPSNGKFPDSLKTLHIHNWATQLLNSLQLSHLTVLQIRNCPQLESFQGRELHMPTLVSLEIFGCERLRSLSSHMQNLQSLQNLTIWNCHQLEFFPEVGLPNPKLVFFQIDQCKNMRSLPNQMQNCWR
ncbi:putative disease resistance protein At3g14460 [Hevea brasiliensis]|uniref:putative disease resistance protein At3g14460 n=1 Tax=Hevea brasiliensis TaxID=3981 RepID=UPI0025EB2BE9|nr:putative disease resistance protein At3g14460 [Hevea brasiliensis]